ncbi:diaminopimelate epimerase [Fimbriimonas ginsengisoli]|uniref:Diaminopimelate epimerase n=1 Tax=Fimbriimonas ginsengisoli Gsoil 348 TaxID=661478 RepID=A0A068NL68_FIMGI|nr:diaminopimelate epimerase [Fimbriimonas ginsengisoli]AIE84221.1 diaminopimelate epimerase [Fimbriimonas ginsengisoli Gsoil 348]
MIRRIPFWKLQSVGNDFPLVHLADIDAALEFERQEELAKAPEIAPAQVVKECSVTPDQALPDPGKATEFLGRLSIAICDRHFGVGGDGLLAMGMEGEAVRLRMFNPDGTEDFCGNGIRCAAVHAHAMGWVGSDFTIKHLDREVPTHIGEGQVSTVIGIADYDPKKVPHTGFGEIFNRTVWSGMDGGQPLSLFGSALTTGSTHVVIPTTALPDQEIFESVSAKIEVDPQFPDRTSVIWSKEVAPNQLELMIWERGVGETLGCGTGSSAAAADYLRRKGRGGTVEIKSKGGTLQVEMSDWTAPIQISGTAEQVYRGEFAFKA